MSTVRYYDIKHYPINGGNNTANFRLEIIDKTIVYVYAYPSRVTDDELIGGSSYYCGFESMTLLKMTKINSGYYVVRYENNTIPVHKLYGYYLYYRDKFKDEEDQQYKLPFEEYQIDHINRKRDDLNIDNMRLVSISENMKNRSINRYHYKEIEQNDIITPFLIFIIPEYNYTVYKYNGDFYKIVNYHRYQSKTSIKYKELPYRHDRDTTQGNRTYYIIVDGKKHEINEKILNEYLNEYNEEDEEEQQKEKDE